MYGVNKQHIETLESVDRYFWRKVFKCPFSTPIEVFYMETNTIPIRFTLISRRLMYFWRILQMKDDELVKRVFNVQKLSSCKNDWVIQIAEDLKFCNINKTEEEIMMMKKTTFKKLVSTQIKEASDQYLMKLKNSHSKSKNIWPSNGIKLYLKTNIISTEEKLLLFSMKCRMNDLKNNYKTKHKNNLNCSLCRKSVEESESHLLQCDELIMEPELSKDIYSVKYSDIYGNINEQKRAVTLWKKLFKIRTWKLENRKLSYGPQEHPPSASYSCSTPLLVDSTSLDSSTILQNSLLYLYDSGY